jgi:hypothetical protein
MQMAEYVMQICEQSRKSQVNVEHMDGWKNVIKRGKEEK